ncbi:MAG: hypothetical protein PHI65_01095 [Firmicutes bacterium]|nr:hypothetical protein [Bacillota bacterium]MDD4263082.1 hypothetical protein [Bacillota bacterium]
MKRKNTGFLLLGLGFTIVSLVLNRLVLLPDWLAIMLPILALTFYILYFVKEFRTNNKKK